MALLTLQTATNAISWPAASAGNGLCVAALIKRPTGALDSDYVMLGIATTAALGFPSTVELGALIYGNGAGSNFYACWDLANLSGGTGDTTNDTPLNNKRTLVMVGYADDGTFADYTCRWKDEDGTGATKAINNVTRGSWPPGGSTVFFETSVAGLFVDELMVFDEPYSTALFDTVYSELLT